MKFLKGFSNREIARRFIERIHHLSSLHPQSIKLMEVCGTQTMAIGKAGLRKVLPESINLISGPGCPVCVSPNEYIDTAIAYSKMKNTIISTLAI